MGARGANKSGPWCIPRGLLQSFARPQGEGGPNRVNQPGLFRPDIDHIILVIKFAHLAQELLKLPTAILTHFAFNSASASSTVFGLASECLTSASSRIRVSVSCSLLERQTPSSETNSTKTTLSIGTGVFSMSSLQVRQHAVLPSTSRNCSNSNPAGTMPFSRSAAKVN